MKPGPWHIATTKFDAASGEQWREYIAWAGTPQVIELVSLDALLCKPIVAFAPGIDDPFVADIEMYWQYWSDFAYMKRLVLEDDKADLARVNWLCVIMNPEKPPILPPELSRYRLLGYDLIEARTCVSAVGNCSGWPELAKSAISPHGLIASFDRALDVRRLIAANHPQDPHSKTDLFAVFRDGG